MMTDDYISTPQSDDDREVVHQGENFGAYETIGERDTQEDTLARLAFEAETMQDLSPDAIGRALYHTYIALDKQYVPKSGQEDSGSTVSAVVYTQAKGMKDALVVATLGDASSFVAVYNTSNQLIGVRRLNSVTHKPTDPAEKKRLKNLGVPVTNGRVNGLAVSRAVGDNRGPQAFTSQDRGYEEVITAKSDIDVILLDDIYEDLKTSSDQVGSIRCLTVCDGFTDGAGRSPRAQTKEGHEKYLLRALEEIENSESMSEAQLAQALAKHASARLGQDSPSAHADAVTTSEDTHQQSTDNISVLVSTPQDGQPFLQQVNDGHGGAGASRFLAEHTRTEFEKQIALQIKCKQSVAKLKKITEEYENHLSESSTDLKNLVKGLKSILNDSEEDDEGIVRNFYQHLNQHISDIEDHKDKNNARNFLKSVAKIALKLVTFGLLSTPKRLLSTAEQFLKPVAAYKDKLEEIIKSGPQQEAAQEPLQDSEDDGEESEPPQP